MPAWDLSPTFLLSPRMTLTRSKCPGPMLVIGSILRDRHPWKCHRPVPGGGDHQALTTSSIGGQGMVATHVGADG